MAISSAAMTYFCDFVYKRSAIVLEPSKEYLIESRLGTIAREEGCANVDELIGRLRTLPANGLHTKVVEAMTTNETTFFRDVHPFSALEKGVLPEVVKARGAGAPIHIWCAASSTGQEPYSIAMLLREQTADVGAHRFRIVATDLAEAVLERAREGRYRQLEVNRGLPAPYLVKYFERVHTDWQLKPEVRAMVDYRQLNLVDDRTSFPRADIVFMRNVLIYFDVATKRAILARVRAAMAPDGFLFLGGAETTMGVDDAFERVQFDKGTCYRLVNRRSR